jgi:selenocysteine lyase/cysteine desulfurase
MNKHRRDVLSGFGGLAVAATGLRGARGEISRGTHGASIADSDASPGTRSTHANVAPPGWPRKTDFNIEPGYTYLNAAYTHPIPKVSLRAAGAAAERRGSLHTPRPTDPRSNPKAVFAELIGAQMEEIAYVPSTSFGENLVTQSLELHERFDGNVVTDGLHYEGALMHLLELKKKGLDVRVVQPTSEFRIDMRDLERVVDRNTRLIEVSSVAMYNGFEHDLKAVADLAHAHGAYVYADIIHSAGCGPFDISATGVDFAACSTFKWLMGDFGVGFLYARRDVLQKLDRPVVGYVEGAVEAFYPPNLPAGPYSPVTYSFEKSAAGLFEPGTSGFVGSAVSSALLTASLNYIKELGLANIKAHRQPLLGRLRHEVPRFGFTLVTPAESTGGNITFAKRDVFKSGLPEKLAAAKVNVRFSRHWMRLSPSVYNDMQDIERFLAALG